MKFDFSARARRRIFFIEGEIVTRLQGGNNSLMDQVDPDGPLGAHAIQSSSPLTPSPSFVCNA